MRYAFALFGVMLVACTAPSQERIDTTAVDTTGAAAADPVSTASTEIELRTDKSQYSPGAKVTLTLVNKTDATYTFNPCTRSVMRESNDGWQPVDEGQRICTMEAWLLEPRATRSGDTELPASLEAGRYRVAVSLTREGQALPAKHELAVSEPFTVGR